MRHERFDQLNGMGGLEFLHAAKVHAALGVDTLTFLNSPKKEASAVAKASLTNN